jgi:hypothetical protein
MTGAWPVSGTRRDTYRQRGTDGELRLPLNESAAAIMSKVLRQRQMRTANT